MSERINPNGKRVKPGENGHQLSTLANSYPNLRPTTPPDYLLLKKRDISAYEIYPNGDSPETSFPAPDAMAPPISPVTPPPIEAAEAVQAEKPLKRHWVTQARLDYKAAKNQNTIPLDTLEALEKIKNPIINAALFRRYQRGEDILSILGVTRPYKPTTDTLTHPSNLGDNLMIIPGCIIRVVYESEQTASIDALNNGQKGSGLEKINLWGDFGNIIYRNGNHNGQRPDNQSKLQELNEQVPSEQEEPDLDYQDNSIKTGQQIQESRDYVAGWMRVAGVMGLINETELTPEERYKIYKWYKFRILPFSIAMDTEQDHHQASPEEFLKRIKSYYLERYGKIAHEIIDLRLQGYVSENIAELPLNEFHRQVAKGIKVLDIDFVAYRRRAYRKMGITSVEEKAKIFQIVMEDPKYDPTDSFFTRVERVERAFNEVKGLPLVKAGLKTVKVFERILSVPQNALGKVKSSLDNVLKPR